MRYLSKFLVLLMIFVPCYGQQISLNSLYDLKAGDFTEITTYWYIEDGILTCPDLADVQTDTHKINRLKKSIDTVYFDHVYITSFSSSGYTYTQNSMLRSVDGHSMQQKQPFGIVNGWESANSATITRAFRDVESIVSDPMLADELTTRRRLSITDWNSITKLVNTETYAEIKKRVGDCSGCSLAIVVTESEDFFGTKYDTTGVDIYKPGYWWSAGMRGQYGWIGFIRPASKDSGPFYVHRIRIQTKCKLGGKEY